MEDALYERHERYHPDESQDNARDRGQKLYARLQDFFDLKRGYLGDIDGAPDPDGDRDDRSADRDEERTENKRQDA